MTTYDLLLDDAPLQMWSCRPTSTNCLDLPGDDRPVSSADIELVANEKRSFLLHDALRQPAIDGFGFDYVLIDCPPSLNLLTVNAMVAAHSVLVPLQSEFFALEGLSQLMLTIREVRQTANPALRIEGVLLTMYDGRNNLSQQVEADARDNLGELVFRDHRAAQRAGQRGAVLRAAGAGLRSGLEGQRGLSGAGEGTCCSARTRKLRGHEEGRSDMNEKKPERRGLGRGLSALMADVAPAARRRRATSRGRAGRT